MSLHSRSVLTLVLLCCACRSKAPENNGQGPSGTTANPAKDTGCAHMAGGECLARDTELPKTAQKKQLYGAPLGAAPLTQLSNILESPDDFAGKSVTVSGYVKRACSKKGCWIELATGQAPNAPTCRVKFKDYAFLVPTDSQGSSARLHGKVLATTVSREAVEHYEKEGATFPNKKADGTALEVRIVATGVELSRS